MIFVALKTSFIFILFHSFWVQLEKSVLAPIIFFSQNDFLFSQFFQKSLVFWSWKVYKINFSSDDGKISHRIQHFLSFSLSSYKIKDTFQVNIPTTNPGWKMLLYVAQHHRILSSHPNSKREFVSEKKEIFRRRIEFEFIFHQTRIEFHVRPRGVFGIKLFCVYQNFPEWTDYYVE